MNPSNQIEQIINNPNWRFAQLIPERSMALFTLSSMEDIEKHNFVDHQFIQNSVVEKIEVPFQLLMESSLAKQDWSIDFIWHPAFCGSTLIARALSATKESLSIREPNVLMQLAMFKRDNPSFCINNSYWDSMLSLSIKLLARPFFPDQKIVLKPSNTMNNLISDIIRVRPNAKHLLLYSLEQEFLISNLKKGPDYVVFCDTILNLLSKDSQQAAIKVQQQMPQTGLQKASLAWRLQLEYLTQSFSELNVNHQSQIVSCYFGELIEAQEIRLRDLYDFFKLDFPSKSDELSKLNAILRAHSKGEKGHYNKELKKEEDKTYYSQYKNEIDSTLAWSSQSDFHFDIEKLKQWSLPNNLLGK